MFYSSHLSQLAFCSHSVRKNYIKDKTYILIRKHPGCKWTLFDKMICACYLDNQSYRCSAFAIDINRPIITHL